MARRFLSNEELQQEELRLLRHFDAFCKLHSLRYSLEYGTLIGAVRHHGFIPWDDDLDVSMPRPDYEKLISLCDEISYDDIQLNGYFGMPLELSSILRVESLRVGIDQKNTRDHDNNHLWIDIIPLDALPDDRDEAIKLCERANFPRQMQTAGFWRWESFPSLPVAVGCTMLRPILAARSFRLFWARRLQAIRTSIPYGSTNTIGSLSCVSHGEEIMPRDEYENMTEMEFEGELYPVMGCWDLRLKNWYGDYMTPPAEADRTPAHSFDAWWIEGDGVSTH